MKNLLCHLAQRKFAPTKMLGKHVSHCRECSRFFKKVSALETRLVIEPEEPNHDLCAGILASISSEKTTTFTQPKPKRSPAFSLVTFSAAALIVFALTLAIAPRFSEQPIQVADLSEEKNNVSPKAPRKIVLADALHQNELFRRDAAKLGSHLRENLIFFKSENQQSAN